MANQDQQAKARDSGAPRQKFSEMSAMGKLAHLGKIVLFVCTLGFAYPSIFSE